MGRIQFKLLNKLNLMTN